MSSAIYSTDSIPDPTDVRPASFTVDGLCRLLKLAPTAVVVLAERGDLTLTLPTGRLGYCPALGDVRIVRWRGSLRSDTALLDALRVEHPPEKRDVHLWRMTALGGVMRVLKWRAPSMLGEGR